MAHPSPGRRGSTRSGTLMSGAGTLGVGGTGRVSRFANSVLRENGWDRDAQNIRGDFGRAVERADQHADEKR